MSSFWGRFDDNHRKDKEIEPTDDPAKEITFVPKGEDGDLVLENDGKKVDLDTAVEIDGEEYDFRFEMTGMVPEDDNIPEQFWGQEIAVITIMDYPEPGDTTRMFFFPELNPDEEDMNEFDDDDFDMKKPDRTPEDIPVCFLPGTMIATPDGLRAVESLRSGDFVSVVKGKRAKVFWVAKSHFTYAELLQNAALRPVCIDADSLAPGVPERDLWVSQQHRIALRGWQVEMLTASDAAFAHAKHLAPQPGIPGREWCDGVDYVHLMFDRHHVVKANGAEAESLFLGDQAQDSLGAEARADLDQLLEAKPWLKPRFAQTALPTMKAHEAQTWRKMVDGRPVFRDLVRVAA
ncbi:MAG: Hint domain-containing protein [Shimia sp.]|nr:Hint domain-containing protein [Shimia sp.]